jgi:prefoldin subunit 5
MSEIDPREFGKLEAQVEALQVEVQALRQDIKTLLEMANKSKGGFSLLEWLSPLLLAVSFLLLQPS